MVSREGRCIWKYTDPIPLLPSKSMAWGFPKWFRFRRFLLNRLGLGFKVFQAIDRDIQGLEFRLSQNKVYFFLFWGRGGGVCTCTKSFGIHIGFPSVMATIILLQETATTRNGVGYRVWGSGSGFIPQTLNPNWSLG